MRKHKYHQLTYYKCYNNFLARYYITGEEGIVLPAESPGYAVNEAIEELVERNPDILGKIVITIEIGENND